LSRKCFALRNKRNPAHLEKVLLPMTPSQHNQHPLENHIHVLPKGVKTRPTRRSLSRFEYFSQCEDDKRLPEIPLDPAGWTAAECFHVHETFGHLLPCKEPVMLTRALNGKQWHGLNVTNCAEDYIGRILFASELKANYPEWVMQDILGRARQLAQRDLGYVPTYVSTGEDFTTLPLLVAGATE